MAKINTFFKSSHCLSIYFNVVRGGLLHHKVKELILDESGRCDQHTFHHIKVNVPQNSLHYRIVETGQSLFVLRHIALPFAWYVQIDFASHQSHTGIDEADLGKTLLHDNGSKVGVLRWIAGHVDALQRNRVPFLFGQLELAVQL